MALTVIGLNVMGWLMLTAAVSGHYHLSDTKIFGFGTGVLAYTLGMRHAFDADHIAAIDNTTRKLIQDGKRNGNGNSRRRRPGREWTRRTGRAAALIGTCGY